MFFEVYTVASLIEELILTTNNTPKIQRSFTFNPKPLFITVTQMDLHKYSKGGYKGGELADHFLMAHAFISKKSREPEMLPGAHHQI